MKGIRGFACAIAALTAAMGLTACGGTGSNDKVKLYFDGGGGSGNYSTTTSYKTLETLAGEWNKQSEGFEVVINKASLNGNRSAITSMLQAGTAPDMLFQSGEVINDDMGYGWYADLTPYLQKPNPYEEGNEKWEDIYGRGALAAAAAADGKNYYVCLDNIAIGMLYNMDLLRKAGVEKAPETFSELLACFAKLDAARDAGTIEAETYMHGGLWHEIYLFTSVYGDRISEWDLDGSRTVSSYELVKAYKEGKWTLNDAHFREYLRLCYEKAQHYPDKYLSYDASYNFARGKLAVIDGTGNNMRVLTRNAKFDVAVRGYPVLDRAASEYGGYTTIRGSAGLSSAYWVTNTAINKGEDAVDACVDFLMYLTASKNNSRLVNDLGYALPLKVDDSSIPFFEGLKEEYKADLAAENALLWSACCIPNQLGAEFNDHYQLAMGSFYEDEKGVKTGDIDAVIEELNKYLDGCIDTLVSKYRWEFD